MDYSNMLPQEVKKLIRNGKINCQTSGMCNGYAQANLCILPKDYAFDFYCFVFEIQSRARFWRSAISAQSVLKQWRVRAMYVRIFQNTEFGKMAFSKRSYRYNRLLA